jgi:hypothetical protein
VTIVNIYTTRLTQICVNLTFLIFVLTAILPIIRVPINIENVVIPSMAWFKFNINIAKMIRPIIAKIPPVDANIICKRNHCFGLWRITNTSDIVKKISAESITGKCGN